MAELEAALRARILAADLGVAGVSVDERPQGSVMPWVVLERISDPRPQHLKGYDGARETRVQASVWAATPKQAKAIAAELIDAVGQPGDFEGVKFGRTRADGPLSFSEAVDGKTIFRRVVELYSWHDGD